jgi:A/G-specific adenine glycosylase
MESLLELPGVGHYTAAAVASIAFGLPHAVLDGNVARVLSRMVAEPGDIKTDVVRKRLRLVAAGLLDRKRPGEFNQALMELGATVCTPKRPLCESCPVGAYCEARKQGLAHQLPVRGAGPEARQQSKKLLLIEKSGKVALWQRPTNSPRLAGFWELPEQEQLPAAKIVGDLGNFRHTIVNTTYLVEIWRATARSMPAEFRWIEKSKLADLPISTTAKKAFAVSNASLKS